MTCTLSHRISDGETIGKNRMFLVLFTFCDVLTKPLQRTANSYEQKLTFSCSFLGEIGHVGAIIRAGQFPFLLLNNNTGDVREAHVQGRTVLFLVEICLYPYTLEINIRIYKHSHSHIRTRTPGHTPKYVCVRVFYRCIYCK